jgi:hypothetical protein
VSDFSSLCALRELCGEILSACIGGSIFVKIRAIRGKKIYIIYPVNPVILSGSAPFFYSGNPYFTRIYRKYAEQTQNSG